jgi:pimeloyl-ACP methyl ester carboxylesterase
MASEFYCPDQPGFGQADTREDYWPRLNTLSHANFVEEFATALGLDRFYLAGNSMGADNTIQYVMDHPERVIRFILIATAAVADNVPDEKRVPSTLTNRAEFDGTPEGMRAVIEPIIYRKVALDPDLLEMRTRAANAQKASNDALRAGRSLIREDPSLRQRWSTKDRLSKITIPGIYLYAQDDVLTPVGNGHNQEDTLPNIQFFYPPECGHQGQTDQPDMFNQVFLEFFGDGKVSRKTADWAGVSKRRPEIASLVEQVSIGTTA